MLVHGYGQMSDAMTINMSAPVLSSLVSHPALLPPLLLTEHLLNPLTPCLLRSTLASFPSQPFTSSFYSPTP